MWKGAKENGFSSGTDSSKYIFLTVSPYLFSHGEENEEQEKEYE